MLKLLETRLVYPAPQYPFGDWTPPFTYEEAHFTSSDGTALHGWLLEHEDPTTWIVYLHGNGDHVAGTGPAMHAIRERFRANVFVFDYRGYGRSGGTPHELGVLADGQAAIEWLCRHRGIYPEALVLYGRSLGGAVAIDLAARNEVRGVILERTFTRLTDVAAHCYPWLPVRFAMRNRYHSIDKISECRCPLLISHGTHDQLIPFSHGVSLVDAADSDLVKFIPLDGIDHNDPNPAEYWHEFEEFLAGLP